MREIVHIQGGQCGNQIGAKFSLCAPGLVAARVGASENWGRARRGGEDGGPGGEAEVVLGSLAGPAKG